VPSGVATALVGLLGVAAGSTAAYFTNHETLKSAVDREERQQITAARGVARVYKEQIYGANAVLRTISIHNRWADRNDLKFFDLPPIEDRRLVQSRVSSTSSTRLSHSDEAMRTVASIIDVEPQHPLNTGTKVLVKNWRHDLERGAVALNELIR
jgi:hypothetical protein